MPIFLISLAIQVAFVIHIVKTGRNTMWIWIVIMLPLAGSIAYFIIELLPGLMGSRTGRKVQRNVSDLINPNKGMNEAAFNYSVSDTVENSMKLAEECLQKKMFGEAKQLYEKCLTGIHKTDPDLMYGLARAEFGLERFQNVKTILDQLIKENPDYKNPHAHLLYARGAEAIGDKALALQEYVALDQYYPGPEATYRYAMLLRETGENEKARELLEKIMHTAKISGKHYNAMHKEWIRAAKQQLP